MVMSAIHSYESVNWRTDLKLYKHLDIFRTVILYIGQGVWWNVVQLTKGLKRACVTILK